MASGCLTLYCWEHEPHQITAQLELPNKCLIIPLPQLEEVTNITVPVGKHRLRVLQGRYNSGGKTITITVPHPNNIK